VILEFQVKVHFNRRPVVIGDKPAATGVNFHSKTAHQKVLKVTLEVERAG
jgi:hypothetical protein